MANTSIEVPTVALCIIGHGTGGGALVSGALDTESGWGVGLILQGRAPQRIVDYIRGPPVGSVALSSTAATILIDVTAAMQSLALAIASFAPAARIANAGTSITNANATTNVPHNVEQCDFTGFKQLPGSLKLTWNRHAVRRKSWEERHPQEAIRPRPTENMRRKGSRRPEQPDTFITELYPDGVDSEDL